MYSMGSFQAEYRRFRTSHCCQPIRRLEAWIADPTSPPNGPDVPPGRDLLRSFVLFVSFVVRMGLTRANPSEEDHAEPTTSQQHGAVNSGQSRPSLGPLNDWSDEVSWHVRLIPKLRTRVRFPSSAQRLFEQVRGVPPDYGRFRERRPLLRGTFDGQWPRPESLGPPIPRTCSAVVQLVNIACWASARVALPSQTATFTSFSTLSLE
jgi:hypothetical protein